MTNKDFRSAQEYPRLKTKKGEIACRKYASTEKKQRKRILIINSRQEMKETIELIKQLNKGENKIRIQFYKEKEIQIDFNETTNIEYEELYYIIRITQVAIEHDIKIVIKNCSEAIKQIISEKTHPAVLQTMIEKN